MVAYVEMGRTPIYSPPGDWRTFHPEPPRRIVPRLRKSPRYWRLADIQELVRACYVGKDDDLHGVAVVLYAPRHVYPRRMVRYQRRHHGEWFNYQWWGVAWDAEMWGHVQMGDSPHAMVQAFYPRHSEAQARAEAREWVGGEAAEAPFINLPDPAMFALREAIKYGPGYWGLTDAPSRQ